MTFLVEAVTTGLVKTAAMAAPAIARPAVAALPKLATESIAVGVKALAEPVAQTLPKAVETAAKPVFEAATKPIGELGKGIASPITANVLEAIPAEARLPLLERGFFSKALITETGLHAPVLTPTEMKALGNVVGIDLPEDVLQNPAFAQSFSDAFQNRLLTADKENFALDKTVWESLQDTVNSQKDADELEKFKKKSAKEAIRKRMIEWRKSIVSDPRFKDHPDEEKEALRRLYHYEQRLLLEVDIRFTFGNNIITRAIGEVLADPKAA